MVLLPVQLAADDCMAEMVPYNSPHFPHPCGSDAGGTSPWMGDGRTMQEQLSGATHGAVAETSMKMGIKKQRCAHFSCAVEGPQRTGRCRGGLLCFFLIHAIHGLQGFTPPYRCPNRLPADLWPRKKEENKCNSGTCSFLCLPTKGMSRLDRCKLHRGSKINTLCCRSDRSVENLQCVPHRIQCRHQTAASTSENPEIDCPVPTAPEQA